MRRVTFSRNFTLSLSRTCRCYCKYCAFATHRAHLYSPDEVRALLDDAERRGAKELLVLTGEAPEVNPEVARRLSGLGHPELVVHQGSPTKHPERRLETIRAAGALRVPFTSGILVGIGESPEERVAALEALAEVHAEHGHLQEVILQNFVPHPRLYGAEPAEIADTAQREGERGEVAPMPAWGSEVSLDEMRLLVRESKRLMPDVGVQIPPNLSDWWLPLVEEGATDLGGLSANGDHISPEHPFPS